MHMVSKNDFDSAELETMRTSRSSTTVMTANGEVQTREEATANVKQLDLFVLALMIQYWITPIYFLLLFMKIMFRSSIQDGTKFYYVHPQRAS